MVTRLSIFIIFLLAVCRVCDAQQYPRQLPLEPNTPKNLIQVSPNLFCGAEPKGKPSFQKLADLGVRTVVSVDGLPPQVDEASSVGLRYVHIPIGYGLPSRREQLSLASVIRTCEKPVFVHCHHGKHRGPTAAAIAWLFSNEQPLTQVSASESQIDFAKSLLKLAGTDAKYKGLWQSLGDWRALKKTEQLPRLYSVVHIDSLAPSMAQIDHAMDRIIDVRGDSPKPDVTAATEITEGFRESLRWIATQKEESIDPQLSKELKEALKTAEQFESALQSDDIEKSKRLLLQLQKRCSDCHARFR